MAKSWLTGRIALRNRKKVYVLRISLGQNHRQLVRCFGPLLDSRAINGKGGGYLQLLPISVFLRRPYCSGDSPVSFCCSFPCHQMAWIILLILSLALAAHPCLVGCWSFSRSGLLKASWKFSSRSSRRGWVIIKGVAQQPSGRETLIL